MGALVSRPPPRTVFTTISWAEALDAKLRPLPRGRGSNDYLEIVFILGYKNYAEGLKVKSLLPLHAYRAVAGFQWSMLLVRLKVSVEPLFGGVPVTIDVV